MLDILVGELLAPRTLRKAHTFSQRAVVGFRVLGVEGFDGVAAFYADGHSCTAIGEALRVWRWGCGASCGMRACCLELGALGRVGVSCPSRQESGMFIGSMRNFRNS